jgi:hypothetical protein
VLDHRPRNTAKSDSLISKEGESREEFYGCRFPDREIEGPFSVLRDEERGDPVC